MTRSLASALEALQGQRLHSLKLDLDAGAATLVLSAAEVRLGGVRSTTLLGPWDGTPGVVQSVRVVRDDAVGDADADYYLEIRVQYGAIPRNYRVVCGQVEITPTKKS